MTLQALSHRGLSVSPLPIGLIFMKFFYQSSLKKKRKIKKKDTCQLPIPVSTLIIKYPKGMYIASSALWKINQLIVLIVFQTPCTGAFFYTRELSISL